MYVDVSRIFSLAKVDTSKGFRFISTDLELKKINTKFNLRRL